MAGGNVAEAASEALLAGKEELARAVTDALYAERPDLLETWGERGRRHCLQDVRYTIEHLAPAVALEQPELFAAYTTWLRSMLGARGIPVDDVRRTLELTRASLADHLPGEQAEPALAALTEGLAALESGGT